MEIVAKKIIDKLEVFVNESDMFFSIPGIHGMDKEVFLIAFKEYIKTDNNFIDEYVTIKNIYLVVSRYEDASKYNRQYNLLDQETIKSYRSYIKNEGFWNIEAIYSEENIKEINYRLDLMEKEYERKRYILEESGHRNTPEYKEWRKSVFKRDKYTCQDCGQKGGDLEAHHIHPFKKYPKKRYDINNGKTLCILCHRKIHKIMRTNG